jgi:hypothetical protein
MEVKSLVVAILRDVVTRHLIKIHWELSRRHASMAHSSRDGTHFHHKLVDDPVLRIVETTKNEDASRKKEERKCCQPKAV